MHTTYARKHARAHQRNPTLPHCCSYGSRFVGAVGLLSAVGISGQDIAVASAKLTMGVVWQLMRADVLRFLSTVQVDASHACACVLPS